VALAAGLGLRVFLGPVGVRPVSAPPWGSWAPVASGPFAGLLGLVAPVQAPLF
jgi:hypothetical protein